MYEHNALGYWSGLALCLTKIRSSRARCPATALIGIYNRSQVSVYRTIGPLVYRTSGPVLHFFFYFYFCLTETTF